MWIIFEWVRSRRRGWPAKLERTSQTEEVSCRWKIFSSKTSYIFSLSFVHCEFTKKIICSSGLVGHLIDWKLIFASSEGEYSQEGNFSSCLKFDLNVKMLPRTWQPHFLRLFARTLVNDEKCDVRFKFGTYYFIRPSITMAEVIFGRMVIKACKLTLNSPTATRDWRWWVEGIDQFLGGLVNPLLTRCITPCILPCSL